MRSTCSPCRTSLLQPVILLAQGAGCSNSSFLQCCNAVIFCGRPRKLFTTSLAGAEADACPDRPCRSPGRRRPRRRRSPPPDPRRACWIGAGTANGGAPRRCPGLACLTRAYGYVENPHVAGLRFRAVAPRKPSAGASPRSEGTILINSGIRPRCILDGVWETPRELSWRSRMTFPSFGGFSEAEGIYDRFGCRHPPLELFKKSDSQDCAVHNFG